MSHYYGCLQRLNPYGPCSCEAIQQADHTSALNRLADEMAMERTEAPLPPPDHDLRAALRVANALYGELATECDRYAAALKEIDELTQCALPMMSSIQRVARAALSPVQHSTPPHHSP